MSNHNNHSLHSLPSIHDNATPGNLLKQARQQLELSPAQIAARLRLELKIIVALEENDFQQLPTATFVKGYLRAYAQLVKLNPETVLAAYQRIAPTPMANTPAMTSLQVLAEQETKHSRWAKIVTLFIILVVAALIIRAWYVHY